MKNDTQIIQCIFEFIAKNTTVSMNLVTPKTLLFKEGIFDSMGFLLLIDFLEDKFNIQTSDNDLIEENFESVSAMADFIQRKRKVETA